MNTGRHIPSRSESSRAMADSMYARFKRLLETYQVDPFFRSDVEASLPGLFPPGEEKNMREAILCICRGQTDQQPDNPYVHGFREWNIRVSGYVRESVGPQSFRTDGIYGYLQRVRSRCRMESSLIRRHPNIYYFPMAFELSQGCRVGCPFCGLMAERFQGNAAMDEELWLDMICSARDYLGDIAGESPGYFATEPLDHPDYERFLALMQDVTGRVPQTTTAVADREPQRLRSLIAFLGEKLRDQARLRLSIRTRAQFYRISKLFSPQELEHVELLPNNPESFMAASDSGRNRSLDGRAKIRYSICCVSGLKVNLCSRTMTFLEPVLPDVKWPCGYRVLEERHFGDAEAFRGNMRELYERHAVWHLSGHMRVQLHPDVKVLKMEDSIVLAGDGVGYRFRRDKWTEKLLENLTSGGDYAIIPETAGLPPAWRSAAEQFLDTLLQKGYIVTEWI